MRISRNLIFSATGLLLALTFSSCQKDEPIQTSIYLNDFTSASDLNDFVIGQGDISIVSDGLEPGGNAFLRIYGWCLSPNLTKEIGPFAEPMSLTLKAEMKSAYGAIVYLQLPDKVNQFVKLETHADLFKARKWNTYKSDVLSVPAGERLTLWVDTSNQTLSETFIDNLEIIALE
jgi:hypothetical protein